MDHDAASRLRRPRQPPQTQQQSLVWQAGVSELSLTPSPAESGTIYASSTGVHNGNGNSNGAGTSYRRRRRSTLVDAEDSIAVRGDGYSNGAGDVKHARSASAEDDDSDGASPTTAEHQRKKQKRNKPTLSCFECVGRKTKVGKF